MKSLLELHLQKACENYFPNANMVIRLRQKKFADYSLDNLLYLAKEFDLDIVQLGEVFSQTLLKQEGVHRVCIEKSCYLNIYVDAYRRYELIFHGVLDQEPLPNAILLIDRQKIEYALLRLQTILAHLSFEKCPVYPTELRTEEKKILDCLDELLSAFQLFNVKEIARQLNDLGNNIHGYLRVITLLCEDKMRFHFQTQLLTLSDLMLKNGILVINKQDLRE